MSERERAQSEAAKVAGKIEGVKHLLDIVVIMIADDATRARVTGVGHGLMRMYQTEQAKWRDRFIEAVQEELRDGVWAGSRVR